MAHSEFTIDDLRRILRECAGVDENVDLDGDILDDSFEQLGYDSLALYQTVGQIGREWDVTMEEFLVSASETPRTLVGAVNKHIAMNADVRPSA